MDIPGKEPESGRWAELRRRMVDEQLRRRNVSDERVLGAMLTVPRERFVSAETRAAAYKDRALQIGHGQTISQPFIVAYMTEQLALSPRCTVLEIGTGTGYQTAVLALLAGHVYTVERLAVLQQRAVANLAAIGLANVTMIVGDGSVGLAANAPYDRIIATAAAPKVPATLLDQLADGGVLVMPVGGMAEQTIVRVTRNRRRTTEIPMLACRFVKLIGEEGWPPREPLR